MPWLRLSSEGYGVFLFMFFLFLVSVLVLAVFLVSVVSVLRKFLVIFIVLASYFPCYLSCYFFSFDFITGCLNPFRIERTFLGTQELVL